MDNRFVIVGKITCYNAMTIYKKSLSYLTKAPALEFDFAEVRSSDSAAIALIIEWLKFAKSNTKTIHFYNLPQELLSLAKAAGLQLLISRYA